MSGFEIAGVVLGALPLLVNGLRQYAEGASTIKRMIRAPGELRSLSRQMQAESEMFRNTTELLLKDCLDDDLLQKLLNDSKSDHWAEPEVERALRRKLDRSYDTYMATMEDMNASLVAFRERLMLSEDGKGPFNDPNAFREAFARFRFGIRKADYLDLMERIAKKNNDLHRLSSQSASLEPARRTRKRIPDFVRIRDHAASMFTTLQSGMRGPCQASHRASLYMRPVEGATTTGVEEEHAFRIVLQHEFQAPPPLPSHWTVEETEFRLLDAAISSGSICPKPANFAAAPAAAPTKGKKKLRWQDPPKASPAPTGPSSVSQQQALSEIRDLCESIQSQRASRCGICLGYLQDQVNAHRHGLYWPEKPLVSRNLVTSVSLGSLLEQRAGAQPNAKQLSVADSRSLALALSWGVLRLHDTPWLAKQWTRDDIVIFKHSNAFLARHPFVSADLHKAVQPSNADCSPAIRNETLFALGVVLIELCLGQNFESLYLPEDLNKDGTKHPVSAFLAANRLIDRVYNEAGKRYGDAVRRCILCEFDQRKTSLEDDAFRRAVYDNVVAVLEEDVSQFFGL